MNEAKARFCKECGIDIRSKNSAAIYCSRKCRDIVKHRRAVDSWEAKICPVCEKEFKKKEKGAVYCSRTCWAVSEKGPDKFCEACGVQMPWNSPNRTCSTKCGGLIRRKENPKREEFCLNCGTYILDSESQFKYCSHDCAYEHRTSPPIEDQICKQCGCGIVSNKKRVFCGTDCQGVWSKENILPYIGSSKKDRLYKDCAHCGGSFYRPDKNVRYCSTDCYRKQRRLDNPRKPSPGPELSQLQRGGLTPDEFTLYEALISEGQTGVWHPQFWISPFGEIDDVTYYLIDLANVEQKIAIEVDGSNHRYVEHIEKDRIRDKWLNSQGWTVLRFSNEEVRNSLDSVVDEIASNVTI